MNEELLLKVLLASHVSEKSTFVGQFRQYVFKVAPWADKKHIKAAVEKMFNVLVEKITVSNVKGKTKVFKQQPGKRDNWKKAYITLKEGQQINFTGDKK